nr:hypothetical protein [Variovorax boronicumulans]
MNVTTTRCDSVGGERYILLSRRGDVLDGLRFSGGTFSDECEVRLSDLDPATLEVRHYYGLDRVTYSGASSVVWGMRSGWPYAVIWIQRARNHFFQGWFNRRKLATRRRSEILAEVVELAEEGGENIHALTIMSKRYGNRWADHPRWDQLQAGINFHLERLADTGELRKQGIGYTPTGLAMKTLEDSEEQERRTTKA